MKFSINSGYIIGELAYADSIEDLLENKLLKRQHRSWQTIQYRDEDDDIIEITREFLDDQGMTLDEVVNDWKMHGQPEEEIEAINSLGNTIKW